MRAAGKLVCTAHSTGHRAAPVSIRAPVKFAASGIRRAHRAVKQLRASPYQSGSVTLIGVDTTELRAAHGPQARDDGHPK